MAEFKYSAINEDGERVSGKTTAKDKFALARSLRSEGLSLVSAEQVSEKKRKQYSFSGFFNRVSMHSKILFARNLSAMISAGLPLSRAISVMERQEKNQKFQKVLFKIRESVQQGNSFADSLSKHKDIFPLVFIAMVKAGEESGKLADSLSNIATQMDKVYQLKKRIQGAMVYPAIVITAMIIIAVVMLIFVVPTITSTLEELEVELPLTTRAVIATSNFVQGSPILFFLVLLVIVISPFVAWRNPKGRRFIEMLLLKTPVISDLVRETNSARMARTFSSLLNSGVEVVSAVGTTREVVQNSYFKDVLLDVEKSIQKGTSVAEVFSKNDQLYPPLVSEMIGVGEEAGNLPEMLERVAIFFEGEVEQKTKNLSTIVEPILMVLVGIAVGFFAISIISPIYSVSQGL